MSWFRGNSKFFSSFSSTTCQYFTSVRRSHTFSEAVFISSFSLGRLKCSFHRIEY
nr:MAG TPA: hypothetical protein [Caudoviricetes sp.]